MTIDFNKGDNKVSVASGVTGFTAFGFTAGDSISGLSGTPYFANNTVAVGSVTISGIAAPENKWFATDGGFAYGTTGAHSGTVTFLTDEISGLKDGVTADQVSAAVNIASNGTVTITDANILDTTKALTISGDGYSLGLGSLPQSTKQEDNSWTRVSDYKFSYTGAGDTAGWYLSRRHPQDLHAGRNEPRRDRGRG